MYITRIRQYYYDAEEKAHYGYTTIWRLLVIVLLLVLARCPRTYTSDFAYKLLLHMRAAHVMLVLERRPREQWYFRLRGPQTRKIYEKNNNHRTLYTRKGNWYKKRQNLFTRFGGGRGLVKEYAHCTGEEVHRSNTVALNFLVDVGSCRNSNVPGASDKNRVRLRRAVRFFAK